MDRDPGDLDDLNDTLLHKKLDLIALRRMSIDSARKYLRFFREREHFGGGKESLAGQRRKTELISETQR